MDCDRLAAEFRSAFGSAPEVITVAPGRINLIGEHTDYNDGFVFPVAIDRELYVAVKRAEGDKSTLRSIEMGEGQSFDAATVKPGEVEVWSAYGAGMAWSLREKTRKPMPNIQALVHSDVPIGSGVSSSAAIELAFGVAWNTLENLGLPNKELALLGQKCENGFVGVQTGIMDQMASAMGREGQAMFIDTRSLDITYAPVPSDILVGLLDTKTPRQLTSSAYNERRSQCEEAARALGVAKLRDATMEMLEAGKGEMSEVAFRRARHVITENGRCRQFVVALKNGDTKQMGDLMRASHISLRDDYEVSSRELDQMAEAAWKAPGCVGARMTGAGFGGACVALVMQNEFKNFAEYVSQQYERSSGLEGNVMACRVVEGARTCRWH